MKFFRKIKAALLRTFVADCPVCHNHFYGHKEHKHHVKVNNKHYRIICHKCAKEHGK